MALLQKTIPTLKETTISFVANAEFQFNRTCEFIAIIDLSGSLELSINNGDFTTVRGGIAYKMPAGELIFSILLRETAGATANVVIATGVGDIQDNRASFAGNLPIVNAASPNDSLQVDLLAADPGLVALAAAIIADQADDAVKRAGLTTLAGATFFENAGAASGEIVSAAANTAGIIVRRAVVYTNQMDDRAYFAIDDGAEKPFVGIFGNGSTTTTPSVMTAENIFIPAGVALDYNFETAGAAGYIWYEVL